MIIDVILFYGQGRGGLENVVTTVTNCLVKKGHKVRVIQAYEPEYSEWMESVDEFYSLFEGKLNTNISMEVVSNKYGEFIENKGRPDVVLATHAPYLSYMCYMALSVNKSLADIPIISWLHGPPHIFGDFSDKFLSVADAHLAISEDLYNDLYKIDKNKRIYLVNNPLDIEHEFIKRGNEELRLLFIGRLDEQKRVDILLNGLKNLEGKWRLDVVGDGVLKNKLISLSNKLNIGNRIKWHGWSDNPWKTIDECSLLILTSDYEGFGLVVVEALSRGIPVISTKTEGPSKIISNGVNGWLIEKGASNELNKILVDIQNERSELPSQQLCKNSILKFDKNVIVDNLEKKILLEYVRKRIKRG